MTTIDAAPVAWSRTYAWTTNVMVSFNGTQQRSSSRLVPRVTISAQYLLGTTAEIQFWNDLLFNGLDDIHTIPLWDEGVHIPQDLGVTDTLILGDFSKMDADFNPFGRLIQSDGVVAEDVFELTRTDTEVTTSGLTNNYTGGSNYYPNASVRLESAPTLGRHTTNAGTVSITAVGITDRLIDANGSVALTLYKTKAVLDRRHDSPGVHGSTFNQLRTVHDFGGKIEVIGQQVFANIRTSRSYTYQGGAERQWWKSMMNAMQGRLKSFYVSTYRPDIVISSQPSIGSSTLLVTDDADLDTIWDASTGHADIAVDTLLGPHYTEITSAVDNMDGTMTLTISPALPASADGSTVLEISFLELSHLASDTISVESSMGTSVLSLVVETIEQ